MPEGEARHVAPDQPATPRAGGLRTMLRPSVAQVVMALLIGGLAFAMTLQLRDDRQDDFSGVRGEELVELLKSLDAANDRLGTQIDELTETRDGLRSSSQRSEEAEKAARLRAEQLAILAGTAGATGPGIEIVIDDLGRQIDAAALLDAIEELRGAGAEAIVVNGVARVVAQTYFLDADNEIRVGGQEITRPYRIEAIGDPAVLEPAVRFLGGLIDRVENRGGTATLTTKDKVTITALADVKTPEYARPTS